MTNNVCNICGANYVFKNGRWVCPACGAFKPEELSNEEVTLLYNAQQQLRLADFDEAESLYRDIIEKYPSNHEGYWGLVLAKYGIKYEQDYNGKMIPTCYAASYESVLRDKNYLRALELCDGDERRYLEEQADKIERIRREWVEQASKEPAYDIFLSYKDTESGTGSDRTKDSYEAKELYDELTRLGYRVFFSRESLKGKAGENFEPYIFNALNTAHVMIVYGSRPEYFEATWIKNEWSRFLKRINNGEKQKNALIVVYNDLNPKDLVSPLNRLQGIDRKRLDFSRVLEKYCEKVVSAAKTVIPKIDRIEIGTRTGRNAGKIAKLETVELKRRDTAKSEIKRETVERREIGQYTLPPLTAAEENQLSVANAYLASGNFDDAEKIYSAVLENNPQNGSAIVGLLFTAACSKGFDEFGAAGVRNFTSWDRFEKALAFSDAGTSEKLLSAFATEAYRALRAGETEKSKAIYSHIENYDSESVSRLRRELCTYVLDLIVKDPDTAAFFIDAYLLYEADTDRYIDTLSNVVKRAVKEGKFEFAEKYQKEWLSYAEDEYASNLAALKVRFKTRTEDGVLDAIENAGEFSALETVLRGLNAESAARLFTVVSNRVNSIVLSDRGNAEAALGWIRTFFKYDFAERTNSIRELLHAILSSPDARRAEIFDLLLMMSDADEETTYELYKDYADRIRLAGDFVLADRYYGKAIDVRETEECWKGRLMCHLGVPASADYPKKIGLLSDWTIVETILSLLTPSDRVHFLNKMLEYALAALSLPGTKHETIVSIADKFFSYFPQESNGELTRHLAAFAEKLKELKQFDAAERMYATLLGFDNRNHVAYWGLLQAKLKCRSENELVKQLVPLSDLPEFTNALLAAGSNSEAMQRYIGIQNRQRSWLERVEKRKKALRKLRRISAIAGVCAAVALVIAGVVFGIVTYHAKESVLKFTRDGEGVSVSAGKYYKSDEVLVIPSESEGLPVVSVKKGGFRGHSEIREVVLPDTLIAIGDEAFAGCTNLESVTFANNSSSASLVVVPRLASAAPGVGNAVLSRLSVIGARAFQGCMKLTEITLPQGLTSIGDEAFADTGLVSVTIPETVVSVGKKVFENCEQLTEIRVVNRDEIPAEWDENWGGNSEEKIVYSLRVLLDYSKTDDPDHVGDSYVFFGEKYSLPVPTRAGYVFNGWYRENIQLTNESGVSLSVWGFEDGGMATPRFTANENTVFFNGNGETSGDTHSQKLHTDETGALNANGFVRNGYTFVGWSTEQNGTVEYLDGADLKMSAEPSLVLYAIWEANRNTLHFNANGGEGSMQDIKVKTDSTAILPACAYSIPGYDFCGWAFEPTGTPVYEDEAELKMGPESSLVLYAIWEATPNLLVFDANGGEGTMQTLRLQTDATSAIPACTYSMRGYDFCGWAAEPDGEIVFHSGDSYTMGTNPSYTLYAVWQMATYTVTYALNNGTVDENPTSYTIESALFTLNQPSRPGYVFIGWSGTDLSQPTKTVTIPSNSVGNRTYTANWEANLNTLHFNANGGEGTMSDLSIRTDATSDLPVCSLSRRGYAFVGWSTTEDGTASVNDHASYQMGAENEYTLYAVWEVLSFRIVCDSQSGTISEDELTAEYGSTPTLPVPVLDHYVFGGWYSAIGGGGTQYADSTGVFVAPFEDCEDLNLYAYWKCSVGLTYSYSSGTYKITGISSQGITELYLPEYYNGYPVVSIEDGCFSEYNSLQTLYVSSHINSINQTAFMGCSGLDTILVSTENTTFHSAENCLIDTVTKNLILGCKNSSIPNDGTVTSIRGRAFYGCSGLTNIIVPNSVTSIGESAFSGCSNLKSIVIPDSVSSLPSGLLSACASLVDITIPFIGNTIDTNEGITHYPFGWIFGSDPYINGIEIQQEVKFSTYAQSVSFYIPSTLRTVTVTGGAVFYHAFENCSMLTSVAIPAGADSIGDYAFLSCSGLNELPISNSIISIGENAFDGCTGLTSISIPNGVKTINRGAFSWCSGLTSISVPGSVNSIGAGVFLGCSALENLVVPFIGERANNNQYPLGYLFGTYSFENGVETIQPYQGDDGTSSTAKYYIPLSLKTVTVTSGVIRTGAFYNCSNLLTITMGDGVTKIGNNAFYNCSLLNSITIGDNVTSIGSQAFYGCSKLSEIIIPDGVTSINAGLFIGCSSLTSIIVSNNTILIDDNAFSGCTELQYTTYDNGLYIGSADNPYYVFVKAVDTSITSCVIHPDVKIIYFEGFRDCTRLTNVGIPDGVTTIGSYAFSGCYNLNEIVLPDSLLSIGESVFAGCAYLQSITIPFVGNRAGITSSSTYQYPFGYLFGTNSYTGGTKTTSYYYGSSTSTTTHDYFYIPANLKSVTVTGGIIPYGSFYACHELTSITLQDGVTNIGSDAFDFCTGLASITIPDSVTSIGCGAFAGCSSLTTMTIPFVGESRKASSKSYQYPFGYIFGKSSYTGGTTVTQSYSSSSGSTTTSTTYYVPSSLRSVTVTDGIIPYGAFYGCTMLTSITVLDGITSIGDKAFYCCTGLTSIRIPSSVTMIGNSVFYQCTRLKSFSISDNVTNIGDYAFYNCTGLISLDIGNSVIRIGDSAFSNCTSINSISVPESVTSIGKSAFCGCSSATSIEIPSGVLSIGVNAFKNCSAITSIEIPNSITTIGNGAFSNCDRLALLVWNATNCTYAGDASISVFSSCSKLTTIVLGDNVKTIPANLFRNCNKVTSIVIPDNVTSIGDSAFAGCSSLSSIVIPNCVETIGASVFNGCLSLESITVPFVGNRIGVTALDTNQYPFGYLFGTANYNGGIRTQQWTNTETAIVFDEVLEYYIPASLRSVTVTGGNILPYAFANCSGLTEIFIPNTITEIGGSAFSGCTSLHSFAIPEGVKTIGNYAFSTCIDLTEITIPNSVTEIGDYAFDRCSGLTEITIPDSVLTIGYRALFGCSSLESITIPFIGYTADATSSNYSPFGVLFGSQIYEGANLIYQEYATDSRAPVYLPATLRSVTVTGGIIFKGSFYNCSQLTSITIGDGVTRIEENAFYNCSGVSSLIIPDSVISIGASAFAGCSSLEQLTIPFENRDRRIPIGYFFGKQSYSGGTAIKQTYEGGTSSSTSYTYYIPSTLRSVTITRGYIPWYAFENCTDLTSITIEDGVTEIGDYAFVACKALTTIVIPDSVTRIGNNAFHGCSNLTSVIIGDGVTIIGAYAFDCYGLTSVTFVNPNGWYVVNGNDKTNVTLTDVATNALYFKASYANYYWYRDDSEAIL